MRITSLCLKDVPPVRHFAVDGLSEMVVIGGPNGVGKTRLMQAVLDQLRSGGTDARVAGTITATHEGERERWGQSALDLSLVEDVQKLHETLAAGGTRRTKLQSSLINFESDRKIQNLQPYPFSFEMPDPEEEAIGWDTTFTPLSRRYEDTVQAMHRMVDAQRRGISSRAVQLQREGHKTMNLTFDDPMTPFKDIFRQLVGPKELADLTLRDQKLRYTEDGNTFEFESLSSDEREVVNIAFDFLLRAPTDCIVVFDEPELHLHPELSYKLVQALQRIGERNQFIFTTHSAELISASLDRTAIFLAKAASTVSDGSEVANQAVVVSEADVGRMS
jgi:predicted ATP-dependent endonuclease of OLD family